MPRPILTPIAPLLLIACGTGAVAIDETPPGDTAPEATDRPEDVLPGDSASTTPPSDDTAEPPAGDSVENLPSAADLEVHFDPPGGTFTEPFSLTLSAGDADAAIYYTVDGSAPTPAEGLPYSGAFVVDRSTVVRAMASGDLGEGVVRAQAYVELAPDVEDFTSPIPILVLHSFDEAPTDKSEIYTPFTLSVLEPDGDRAALLGAATVSTRAGLRVRGSSSSGYPKKPYRLETWRGDSDVDEDVALLGMPADGDWVLYAPLEFDRAFVRNALVYALSNAIGRYAPRTAFAEVFVADRGQAVTGADYVGVYVVIERIERGGDRVDIAALDPTDVAEPEVTGGYLYKRDRLGDGEYGFWAGDAGGAFSFSQPLVYVEPDEDQITPQQAAYLEAAVNQLADAIAGPDFTHPATGEPYATYLDVDDWIDHHVLNVFPKNPDAFRLSGYLYKDREGRMMSGPVWDFDRTMGCSSDTRAEDPENWDATNQTSDTTDVFDHGWWRGLFDDPIFRDAWRARWLELLYGPLSLDEINALVDELTADLDEPAARNFERWSSYPPRGGTYASEVQILKNWLAERHAWILDCVENGPDDPRRCGR